MISRDKTVLCICSVALLCATTAAQTAYKPPHGLSPGSIAGIVIGAFLAVLILVVILAILCTPTPKTKTLSKDSKRVGASWRSASAAELTSLPPQGERTAEEMAEMRMKATDPPTDDSSTQTTEQQPQRKKRRPAA